MRMAQDFFFFPVFVEIILKSKTLGEIIYLYKSKRKTFSFESKKTVFVFGLKLKYIA